MELEDVLRQNSKLEEFLQSLVAVHAKALRDQGLADQLDAIRRDILICFNDLESLNEMLISCDGQIREEIDTLQKCKQRIAKLARKRRQLLAERDHWSEKKTTEAVKQHSPVPFVIDASYRSALEQYLKLADANDSTDDGREQEDESSPDRVWQSLDVLKSCRDAVTQSVKQTAELLHEFQKDQEFIEKEIKAKTARVRRTIGAIDDKLHKNRVARRELMSKVGLPSTSRETSTAERLLHLDLNGGKGEELQSEEEDIANHAEEFIDMKIASLQDQLTHKKENSSVLAVTRDLWSDCIECVRKLEDRLKSILSDDMMNLSNATSDRIKSWIEQSLQELTDIISSTDHKVLIELVTDEREVIDKAYQEITKTAAFITSAPAPAPKSKRSSPPPFLIASKSPPKTGISDKTAQRLNGDTNATASRNITFLKGKSTKKE